VQVDADKGLIMVKGSVPGSDGNWVLVRDAAKRPRHKAAPFPAAIRQVDVPVPAAEAAPVEEAPAVVEAPVAEAPAPEAPATESEG
jgi:large subunit ribosomal protein L3